ncbi:MAG: hypothetical protein ACPGIC_05960 [Opitutales bacterium]
MAIKKTTTRKAARKVAPKKAPKKQAPAKKAPAKKATRKVATKKVEKTSITASVDVGFGNSLYIRGEGAGLSWETGTVLKNVSPNEWSFSATGVQAEVHFKFLINDELWSDGDNLTVAAGGSSISSPVFNG